MANVLDRRCKLSRSLAFFNDQCNFQILGWAGFVRVDGVGFNFLGAPDVPGASFTHAVQKSLTVSDSLMYCIAILISEG